MKYLRKLYDWVLSWADSKYGIWALGILAFAESSFFPIPPDILLIALAVGNPRKALLFAGVCSIGSVIGGICGYFIGMKLWIIAEPILQFYGWYDKMFSLGDLYREYTAWVVAVAGFTPIPYKVFTITGGYFRVPFTIFVVASCISRSARFFLVSSLIMIFGEKIKRVINRYFNIITLIFFILLIGGVVLLKRFF